MFPLAGAGNVQEKQSSMVSASHATLTLWNGHPDAKSLFGRAYAGASAPAPTGAVPNACFGKGSAWGAGQEPEPFFACAGKASKTSFARLLAVGSRRLVRRSRFAKRFSERFQLL